MINKIRFQNLNGGTSMIFRVISRGTWYGNENDVIYLQQDLWDDFHFKTTFEAYYLKKRLGSVKIGFVGMEKHQNTYKKIPTEFQYLDDSYFSLWQSEKDYKNISELNSNLNINIFDQLNDIAYDLSLLNKFSKEESLQISLFREITKFQCQEQFHRIATGGSILTDYHFVVNINSSDFPIKLTFDVIPETKPSSNIHVLIGRNGIGKTNLIRELICNICDENADTSKIKYNNLSTDLSFANALCVAFSPFDDYSKIIQLENKTNEGNRPCFYIGLDRNNNHLLKNIEKQFLNDLKCCFSSWEKINRWNKTMEILESDPIFEAINIRSLTNSSCLKKDGTEEYSAYKEAKKLFSLLSSGHKCILSIITSCVSKLEEKSIIFIDEPENHLHPPLLASLMQALSFLLNDRNGVAIISTHSPVVLQEVPKSCVWILNRFGDEWSAKRPEFETFGADIGSLTREVFGLEVLKSGYHKMIKDAVDQAESLDEVIETFQGNLGNEALGLVNILWSQKNKEKI